jgi:transcriptional regulator with XRE-family HTH domain
MQCRPSPLRARRLLRGLRLRDLANDVDLHETTLSEVERGDTPLRGRVLHRLAAYYQTPSDRLLLEHERWQQRATRTLPGRGDDGMER